MDKEQFYVNEAAGGAWSSCNYAVEQLNNGLFNPSWENSMDQSDPFESALSSLVSSPVAATAGGGGDSFMFRELIGRLGAICNSGGAAGGGDVSPQSYLQQHHHNNSTASTTNNSCYTTPLSSPPKLNLSIMRPRTTSQPNLEPGFAERAAALSCFGTTATTFGLHQNRSKVVSTTIKPGGSQHGNSDNTPENPESKEESSVSDANPRKRKSVPRPKAKDTPPSTNEAKVVTENEEANAKRSRQEESNGNENDSGKSKTNDDNNNNNKDNSKAAEPPKDYIHVRARRGQATDSHSLAERVRREKISERMKFLQELVPGCNKVTGKAVMLDEIINYVQSLQRQVEFLSMKLATVNPRMDLNVEALLSKDMFQSRGALQNALYQVDSSAQAFPFGYQPQPGLPLNGSIPNNADSQLAINQLTAALHRNQNVQLPPSNGFGENPSQAPSFWEDDLQSLVQMAFNPNHQSQSFHGKRNLGAK